jgi:preprotein translocase subunit SecG
MKRTLLKKVCIAMAALFLLAMLGVGCATQEDLKAQQKAAEAAAVRAEAAANRAETAAAQADAAAAKCQKVFEKGLKK